MRFVSDFHGDDLDAILSSQVEYVRQTILAVPLKCIRTGARLVGSHPGTDLAMVA